MSGPHSYRNALNAARLAALAGQEAALKWAPNLAGDFSSIIMHLDTALRELRECGPKTPPQRYDIYPLIDEIDIHKVEDGIWVKWSDIESLFATGTPQEKP